MCGLAERAPLLAGVQWCCADLHHREEDDVPGMLVPSAGVLAVGGSVHGVQRPPDGCEVLAPEGEPVHGRVPVLLRHPAAVPGRAVCMEGAGQSP